MFRLFFPCLLLAVFAAFAADGIAPRASAGDYPAHETSGKVAIGAAYVPPSQVKQLFGDDLDKRGYVVFEVGMFPTDTDPADVSPDDFKLRQGKDPTITRAATPHTVASAVHPRKSSEPPKLPENVRVQTSDTVGYESGPYRRGVYTATQVGVGVGKDPNAPPPPPPAGGNDQAGLEQRLEEKSLPATKTTRPVAGYVFFPKPSGDKRGDYELLYFGMDGQVSLKLSPVK
jgi:hypothetical protein